MDDRQWTIDDLLSIKTSRFQGPIRIQPFKDTKQQLATRSSFTLFPNPNNSTDVYLSETGNYFIYSVQGILLGTYIQTQKIDITGLVVGTYIIQDDLGAHQVFIRQ